MPIALIAMDMDGTLLAPGGKTIPEKNLAALRVASARGIHLALASGRLPDDAGFFAFDAGLPMHILALNGGCVADEPLGDLVEQHPFERDLIDRLLAALPEGDVVISLFAGHDLLVLGEDEKAKSLMWGTYIGRAGGKDRQIGGREALPSMLARGVQKLLVSDVGDGSALAAYRERLQRFADRVEVASSWAGNIEVNPKGIHKGNAVRALAERLHIPMKQVMVIGDHDNDISMLRVSGIGVAMGNATEGARAAANAVTLGNDRAGVAAAIRHFALNQPQRGVTLLKERDNRC